MKEEKNKPSIIPMQVGFSPECRAEIIKDGMALAWMALWDVEHNVCDEIDREVGTTLYKALELLKPYAFYESNWQSKYKPNMDKVKDYLEK